jgi:predicted nucleic acid-binding Zn ribbon protein
MASRRSWAKAGYPFCGLVPRRAGKGALLPEARSFDDKFDAVGASSAERGRSAQTCSTSAEFAAESVETAAAVEAPKGGLGAIVTACARIADCASGVLAHACRSDELSAEWDLPRMQRWSLTALAAHLTRSPGTIQRWNGLAFPASSECPGAIKQRC